MPGVLHGSRTYLLQDDDGRDSDRSDLGSDRTFAGGAHVEQELFGKVHVGGGYVQENGGEGYQLYGAHARAEVVEGTEIRAEFAGSSGLDGSQRLSTDGGLVYRNAIDAPGRTSGMALQLDVDSDVGRWIGEDTDLLMQGAATLSKNTSSEDNDIVTLVASPQLQHRFDKGRFGIGPVAEYQFVGYAPYVARYGVAGSVSYKLTPDIIIQSQAKFVWQDYDKEDYRDGTKFTGLSRILFPVADQLTGDVSVRYEFERTQRDYLDSNLAGVGVGLTRKWERFDLATSVSAEYAVREFDGNYPLAGYARKDEKLTLSVSASSNRFSIMGTRPSIGYEYVQNNSNIAIKSYNSHNILVGTKRSF